MAIRGFVGAPQVSAVVAVVARGSSSRYHLYLFCPFETGLWVAGLEFQSLLPRAQPLIVIWAAGS